MPGLAPVGEGGVLNPGIAPIFDVEANKWSDPAGRLMVYDPTRDDAYDALVIRDMQTTYGAYWKLNEPGGATTITSRGPMDPALSMGSTPWQAAGGIGPILSAESLGLPNRAFRVNWSNVGNVWLARLNDGSLFNFENNHSYTIEFWTLMEGYQSQGPYPFYKRPASGWAAGVLNVNAMQVGTYRNAISSSLSPSSSALQKWAHWAYTYDGDSLRTYINGALVATTSGITDLGVIRATYGLILGFQMSGLLARMALYGNIVLTPAKIAEHAAAGAAGWAPGDLTPVAMPTRTISPVSPFFADGLVADQQRVLTLLLGTVLESDAALALGRAKTRLVSLVSESDAAIALSRSKKLAVATVTATNTALAFGRRKSALMSIVSESDAAQALARSKTRLLGTVSAVNTALALGRSKAQTLGTALESNAALSFVVVGGRRWLLQEAAPRVLSLIEAVKRFP